MLNNDTTELTLEQKVDLILKQQSEMNKTLSQFVEIIAKLKKRFPLFL